MALAELGLIILLGEHPSLVLTLSLLPSVVTLQSTNDFESLAESLSRKGTRARAPATIVGKSGVKHEFALAVEADSGGAQVVVDAELSVKDVDEMKVLKFYVKVFDVSPKKAILCVTPRLSDRAATLAREYGIEVLEDEAPRSLVGLAGKALGETLGPGRA